MMDVYKCLKKIALNGFSTGVMCETTLTETMQKKQILEKETLLQIT